MERKFFSYKDREKLEYLLKNKVQVKEIAKLFEISLNTLYKEMSLGVDKDKKNITYSAEKANNKSFEILMETYPEYTEWLTKKIKEELLNE